MRPRRRGAGGPGAAGRRSRHPGLRRVGPRGRPRRVHAARSKGVIDPRAAPVLERARSASPEGRPDAAELAASLGVVARERIVDEDVQFTVYRPRTLAPGVWREMLAFAHKTDPVRAPDGTTVYPLEEMRRQAERVLGPELDDYRPSGQDSMGDIARGTELRFLPAIPGIEFNPPFRAFRWMEPVHREEFRMRADPALDGLTARGALSVDCGALLVGEVPLALRIEAGATRAPLEQATNRRFDKVFASYSHSDASVVSQVEAIVDYLGLAFLRDRRELRAGEVWDERLREMIREADVFQLFWSRNAMVSDYVQQEVALRALPGSARLSSGPSTGRSPSRATKPAGPASQELTRLHFQRLPTEEELAAGTLTGSRPPRAPLVGHRDRRRGRDRGGRGCDRHPGLAGTRSRTRARTGRAFGFRAPAGRGMQPPGGNSGPRGRDRSAGVPLWRARRLLPGAFRTATP